MLSHIIISNIFLQFTFCIINLRLTDSIAKSKRRAERRAQLAAERKEREESKQQQEVNFLCCYI